MNAWDLVKNERYQEAVSLLSEQARSKPSTSVLNNRGMAYLHLGNFDAAFADFRTADQISSTALRTECNGAFCGVALWMAGREEEAIVTWRSGVEASLAGAVGYGDAAGGVTIGNLLMFGAAARDDEEANRLAMKLLKKRLRTKQSTAWPGPVSRYLLGSLSENDMHAAVSAVPILKERESCQAQFYVGVHALLTNDLSRFAAAMQQAFELGRVAKLGAEYYLALYERKRNRA